MYHLSFYVSFEFYVTNTKENEQWLIHVCICLTKMMTIMLIYVDDLIVASKKVTKLEAKSKLQTAFKMTDLEPIHG